MFDVKVKKNILDYSQAQVNNFNFGQRGYAYGTKEQQLVGVIGQTVIQDLLGLPWVSGEHGFDNGIDFELNNQRFDVKTMGRTVPMRSYFVHNFLGLQLSYDVDVLVFCSFNKTNNVLTACGYLYKQEIKEKADFFKSGQKRYRSDGTYFVLRTDLYEVPQSRLNTLNSIQALLSLK